MATPWEHENTLRLYNTTAARKFSKTGTSSAQKLSADLLLAQLISTFKMLKPWVRDPPGFRLKTANHQFQ